VIEQVGAKLLEKSVPFTRIAFNAMGKPRGNFVRGDRASANGGVNPPLRLRVSATHVPLMHAAHED
jgi:hypothetical protein